MQIDFDLVKTRFEKSFNTYSENAIVQKKMANKMIYYLSKINSQFDSILELGVGTGLLTEEIIKKIKFKNYIANDLVPSSGDYVKNLIPRAKFYSGDALKLELNEKFELIISNALFQWFDDIQKVRDFCKKHLKENGFLAFSSFSKDNFMEIRDSIGVSLPYKSLDELKNVFEKEFEIVKTFEFREKCQFATALDMLSHIKKTGVNAISEKSFTYRQVKDLCRQIEKNNSGIFLTYAPLIIICKNSKIL